MNKEIDLWSVVEELSDDQVKACGSGCSCGCNYENTGGSSSSQNSKANNKRNLHSPQSNCSPYDSDPGAP